MKQTNVLLVDFNVQLCIATVFIVQRFVCQACLNTFMQMEPSSFCRQTCSVKFWPVNT